MKKILFILLFFVSALSGWGQSNADAYQQAMRKYLAGLDTLYVASEWVARANAFERIAQAEPKQWLPHYYAALCYIQAFNFEKDESRQKTYSEQAERFIARADALRPNDSEITLLKSMAASMRVRLSPIFNGARYGRLADEMLEKAQQINPDNPRVYVQRASNLYFTPRMWGGDKEKAREVLVVAERKFSTFQPASELHPDWGRSTVQYLRYLMQKE
ncbi:MAG: hypothetical protein RMJ33_12360 [Saprospiraceae bacterium]|nr:hypothetical protein [Saprospiraceae bacterium]